jgi:hypothetical protein
LSGTYTTIQMVTISDATPNANIEYSLNQPGDTNLYMRSYSGPVEIRITETLTAIATASGFNNSAYATATYTIPPDFALAINPTAISVQGGQNGTATITATEVGGFSGFNSPVTFACTGLPKGAACSFTSPTLLTSEGDSYSTTLTVTTAATAAALQRDSSPLFPGSVLAVAFCCFGWKRRRRLLTLLLLATTSAAGLTALNGCSGASNAVSTPPPVSSTVTVTATSGSLTHTTTFTLTVN